MKVIDFHCDTLNEFRHAEQRGEQLSFAKNDLHIDLDKLKRGDYMLQCFAMFVYLKGQDPLVAALEEADIFRRLMAAYPDEIAQVKTMRDIEKNRAEGKISAMLTIEEGGVCKGSLAILRQMYEIGVRIMTLTWNFENELAFPNLMPEDTHGTPVGADTSHGLKEKGFEFVHEMERLGIVIDVSHLSDAGFWDVYHSTTRPFIASHSNARTLCGHVRNLTDDMLRAIAERGGTTGINYCSEFLTEGSRESRVSRMADHIDYISKVGGIDMITLGSDFDGIGGDLEMYDCSCLPMLERELRIRGYHESEIEKVFSGNAMRLLGEFLPAE